MRQLVYTKFISNNRASFHLRWKENLLKHQKVSKYYENDCRQQHVRGNICFYFFFSSCDHNIYILIVTRLFEAAATDMRYFARSKFSRSLVHKKNFSLIWQVVFKSGYVRILSREVGYLLNELGEKSRATIILGKFVNKP